LPLQSSALLFIRFVECISMPIYEYRCADCGHELEKLQKINDDPLRDCPQCGKPRLRRLISAVAFRLKGKGWYETDFKTKDKHNLVDSDKEGKPAEKTPADKSDGGAKTSKKTADSTSKSVGKSTAPPKVEKSDV